MSPEYRRQLIYLMFVAAVVLAAGLGLRDPWPADEPRFALIARDMVESGNWFFPRVGGVIYPDKPPLFFWLVAALYVFTDSLRVSFLLPGVIAGLGTTLLVTDLARRLWDPKTAIWCGATLLAIVQFPLQMKTGQIDPLLCLWTTLGLYGFCRHVLLGPDWRWYAIGGLAAGLGVITKGVGFLPYLVFVPYAFAALRRWPVLHHTWRDWRWLLAPAASLLVIGAWLVPMLLATGPGADPEMIAYRDNILFHQTVTRYANSWGHIKPPWYLFTNAAPLLWLPVTLVLPWLLPAWWRDLGKRNAPVLLLLGWILLVLTFFSLSDGKRSLYIFPAAPALALVAGLHARELARRVGVQRMLVAFPVLLGALLVVVGMYVLMNPHDVDRWITDVPAIVRTSLSLLAIGLSMVIAMVIAAFLASRRRVLAGFSAAMAILWIGVGLLVWPSMDATRSGSGLVHEAEHRLAPGEQLGLLAWPEQFILQSKVPVAHFGYRRNDQQAETTDAVRWLGASADRRLLLPDNWLEPCFDRNGVVEVGRAHRRTWVIAAATSVLPFCQPDPAEQPVFVVRYVPPDAVSPVFRFSAAAGGTAGSRQ